MTRNDKTARRHRFTKGQWVGSVFLLAAAGVLGRDVLVGWTTAQAAPTSLGGLWYALAPESLNLVQAVIQRYLHPALWSDAMQPLLLAPAAGVLGAIGALAFLPSAVRRLRRD